MSSKKRIFATAAMLAAGVLWMAGPAFVHAQTASSGSAGIGGGAGGATGGGNGSLSGGGTGSLGRGATRAP